ncbi:MAG: hypothetical protein KDD83_12740 [Caldilineaceae bacterium]|nr:hypothetical protein [Caldilineaceae bacterium]
MRPPHVNRSGRKFTLSFDDDAPVLWMGLGQVRDLRRQAVAGIIAARRAQPFTGVRDLLLRVELQAKEVRHLIQCGALDGLGASRAALLAEAGDLSRAGSAAQMAFDFGAPAVPPEDVATRLDWERHILGLPVSANPAVLVAPPADAVPLRSVHGARNRPVITVAARLPGWTGGKGFFIGDGADYLVAIPADGMAAPRPWQALLLRGRVQGDAWGGEWLAVEEMRVAG